MSTSNRYEGSSVLPGGYINSERVEYALTNDATDVVLSFPSMFEQKLSQIRNRCMKIDHVVLEYRNQVPVNAVGHVVVEIHDMRLTEGDTKQAEFTIPIKCNCNLHYYSSSYFSVKDKNPWRVEYRVEDTNVVNGVHFCKMMGKLRLSSAKHSTDVEFKSPKIEILSKEFSLNDIDFWAVGARTQTRRLVEGPRLLGLRSASFRAPNYAIGPNESWASRSECGTTSNTSRPYKGLSGLDESAIDPGPSASQVGSMTKDDITEIITKTVEQCIKSNINAPIKKDI
uniref:Movement protein BC1 n=1 Tax=Coccinia mosaic Tamil Nadu virus TaxID=1532882 RepID=A0A0B5KPB2_9GEMI|nr:movement protein [Coccinia mosaic Tamil Nadu virus]